MNKIHRLIPVVFILLLIFGFQSRSSAQSVWVDQDESESVVGIELLIPSLSDVYSTDFPTSAVVLYGRFWAGDNVRIDVDLPISHVSVSEGDLSETDIGNPYVGAGFMNAENGVSFDIGVRLPLAPNFNISNPNDNLGLFTGFLVENYNVGKYAPETFSITSQVKYRWQNPSGLIVKVGGGPDVIFPPDDADAEFYLNYHSQLLYGTENFRIGAGFTGLLIVTESDRSFGERTIHELGIISGYDFGPMDAGAYLRIPLDDEISSDVDFVLGLNFLFSL
jgi:hypothetical protein